MDEKRIEDRDTQKSPLDRVAVCVCTYGRPLMLQACLDSLARMVIGPDLDLRIVVVDNEARPNNRERVIAFSDSSPIQVHYMHEPLRGIARARNAALDVATRISADWIAFIDDDEVAAPEWIAALMAPEYRDTPIVTGKQVMLYPRKLPFWHLPDQQPERPEGGERPIAFTYNVRFSVELLRSGLRFNQDLGLMGGEDSEFFLSARKMGFVIRSTEKAVTYETAHPQRLTYRGLCGREYWYAVDELRQSSVERGWRRTKLNKLHTIPLYFLFGLLEVAISPVFLIRGSNSFKRHALGGGLKIAKSFGRAAVLLGHLPQPYRSVVGK